MARAINTLRRLCDEYLPGRCRVEILDLMKEPEVAKRDGIVAIPTLSRIFPLPMKIVIGDLSITERVLIGLDLTSSR